MRVGIVGARIHGRPDLVRGLVRTLPPDAVVVSGGAEDVDRWAEEEALAAGLDTDTRRPAARTREAFLARNAEIAGTVDELHVFPWLGSRGSWHTRGLAAKRGIPITDHPMEPRCEVFTARWGLKNEPTIFNIMRGWAEKNAPRGRWAEMRPDVRLRASLEWAREQLTAGASLLQVQYAANKAGVGSLGEPWAPSLDLLGPALGKRQRLEEILATTTALRDRWKNLPPGEEPPPTEEERLIALAAEAEQIEATLWTGYTAGFQEEMRWSYRAKALAWGWALTLPRVVFACACEREDRCHRSLAAGFMGKLGANLGGEIRTG